MYVCVCLFFQMLSTYKYYIILFYSLSFKSSSPNITPKTSPAAASGGPYPSHFRSPRWPLDLGFGVWKDHPQRSQGPGRVHGSATWRKVIGAVVFLGCGMSWESKDEIGKMDDISWNNIGQPLCFWSLGCFSGLVDSQGIGMSWDPAKLYPFLGESGNTCTQCVPCGKQTKWQWTMLH